MKQKEGIVLPSLETRTVIGIASTLMMVASLCRSPDPLLIYIVWCITIKVMLRFLLLNT